MYSSQGWHSLQYPVQMRTEMKINNEKPFTEYRQEPTEVNEEGMSSTN